MVDKVSSTPPTSFQYRYFQSFLAPNRPSKILHHPYNHFLSSLFMHVDPDSPSPYISSANRIDLCGSTFSSPKISGLTTPSQPRGQNEGSSDDAPIYSFKVISPILFIHGRRSRFASPSISSANRIERRGSTVSSPPTTSGLTTRSRRAGTGGGLTIP